jgi:hypothetical protein
MIAVLTVQAFLVVVLPVLKYPNMLSLIGPWDSVAHYSFAKWIIEKGYVDIGGNLYYSFQYRFHPGNGILSAILNIVTTLKLGWSMNTILIIVSLVYIWFIFTTLGKLYLPRRTSHIFLLLALYSMSIHLHVYYGGGQLAYAYVGCTLYILVKKLIIKNEILKKSVIVTLTIFLGLLVTTMASASMILAYLLVVTITLLITKLQHINFEIQKISTKVIFLVFLVLSVFMIYEIYVDLFLFGDTLTRSVHIIYSLYIQEIVTAAKIVEVRGLNFSDLILYLISTHTKVIIVLGIILIYTIVLTFKKRILNANEKILTLLLLASYFLWLIGWAGVGSFLSGRRALPVISFLLLLHITTIYEKLFSSFGIKKNYTLIVSFILIILGFSSNFGLPFEPMIKSNGEVYTYPTYSQGGFGDYALYPILYIFSYSGSSTFLCLHPNTAFGLCDLIWYSPKIPKHGFIGPEITTPDTIIEIVKNYLGRNVIIPQPIEDKILPGPIGYLSLYKRPLKFLLENRNVLIYNNRLYTLFLV